MYINPYLAEQLARQHRQQLLDEAALDRLRAQLPRTPWRLVRGFGVVLKPVRIAAALLGRPTQ